MFRNLRFCRLTSPCLFNPPAELMHRIFMGESPLGLGFDEVMSCVINEDGVFSKLKFIAGEAVVQKNTFGLFVANITGFLTNNRLKRTVFA